jgi:asparagine synthase (glutamine-hydrolysing)
VGRGALVALRDAQRHRGPDGEGIWRAAAAWVGLAHTRLAIQDLGPNAAQPMRSRCGRYALAYNGEIYNHAELRAGLDVEWRSTGDAETLLELLVHEGEECLPRLNGMFAFIFVDTEAEDVLVARDPFGQKPLYMAERGGVVGLASETRALVAAGVAGTTPDEVGLAALAAKGSLPGPRTHLRDVRMLPPGTWMRLHRDGRRTSPRSYWRMPWSTTIDRYEDAVARVGQALQGAARRTLVSDVPVGAFLSGGIDSACLLALMKAAGAEDLVAYTVTLPGDPLDEGDAASAIAARLGVEHARFPVDDARGAALLREARERMDVPSIDGANTYIVARVVREAGCKTAVSGVGGDELFGGYPSFADARRLGHLGGAWTRPLGLASRLGASTGGKAGRVARALGRGLSVDALYAARRGLDDGMLERLGLSAASAGEYDLLGDLAARARPTPTPAQRALELEQRIYLHDQLLRDADQFGMACSLEIRAPLLDLELVEVCAQIHPRQLAERGPKRLLVDATEALTGVKLADLVCDRPKQGFSLPIARWSAA